jgi:uncharacterized Rossmann fold enzyme
MNQEKVIERATKIKSRYERRLLKLANVVGVGVGLKEIAGQLTDQVAIIANVTQKKPLSELSARDVVPTELDGVVTDVQEVGYIKAQTYQKEDNNV